MQVSRIRVPQLFPSGAVVADLTPAYDDANLDTFGVVL